MGNPWTTQAVMLSQAQHLNVKSGLAHDIQADNWQLPVSLSLERDTNRPSAGDDQ
jgi:hypothetical protein